MEGSTSEIRMRPARAKVGFEESGRVATMGSLPCQRMGDEQAAMMTKMRRERGRRSLTRLRVARFWLF